MKTPPAKRAANVAWQRANKEFHDKMKKTWRLANPNYSMLHMRKWRMKHKAHEAVVRSEYRKKKRVNDPIFKLKDSVRRRVNTVLKRLNLVKDNFKSMDLLGCSFEFYREYLMRLMSPGMSFENYGRVWEIDHIRPCASFDLSDREEQYRCFHFSNTRPLDKHENRTKWAKVK